MSAKSCQIFNIVHRLDEQSLAHFLEERIDVELSLIDTLLAPIIKRTGALSILLPDLVVLSCKLPPIGDILTFNDVFDKDFLFVLS